MRSVYGTDYLLDEYITDGNPTATIWQGEECTIQKYQGKHSNEYVITDSSNTSSLYYNGVLKRTWSGQCLDNSGNFKSYKNGRVAICGKYENLLDDDYVQLYDYKKEGIELVLVNRLSGITVYRGQYNCSLERHGRGIEFSEQDGKEVLEGIWSDDKLCKITKIFDNGVMTEFSEDSDNLEWYSKQPVYMGGYCFDKSTGKYVRDGVGCLIDAKTRMASRESTWVKGEEIEGVDLIDGCYKYKPLSVSVHEEKDMKSLVGTVTDLIIQENSFNSIISFDTHQWDMIQSLTIGNSSFSNLKGISFSRLPNLRSISIGNNCFTTYFEPPALENGVPYSFKISDCKNLVSIKMGRFCCTNWSNGMELENLPSLETIEIGDLVSGSWNFAHSSFVIHGLRYMHITNPYICHD